MKKRLITPILALLLVLGAGMVSAQEPTGNTDQSNPNPNTPPQNQQDNACYEGGSMAGKCDSEWAWVCGWYLARYEAGIFTREQVHTMCASLLPPLPEPVAVGSVALTWPAAGCYYSPAYSNPPDILYIIWDGNQTQDSGWNLTWNCSIGPTTGVAGFLYVSAPNPTRAMALCAASSATFIDQIAAPAGAWPIYRCQY